VPGLRTRIPAFVTRQKRFGYHVSSLYILVKPFPNMAVKFIVGVMGPGENATPDQNCIAYELGSAIAAEGWITLTGGRGFGVMDAALRGAAENDGMTIGVLPAENAKGSSKHASIKIITGMGGARNQVNIMSSHALVICGMSAGTASEVCMALKADKKIILLNQDEVTVRFFKMIGSYKVMEAYSVEEAIGKIKEYLMVSHPAIPE
jgi:uncharacterized protein (TIGR00725 family)